MVLTAGDEPKLGYKKWRDSKGEAWVWRATHNYKDICLRAAFYAGYEYALRQHNILYGEDAKRLREEVFGKEKEARG